MRSSNLYNTNASRIVRTEFPTTKIDPNTNLNANRLGSIGFGFVVGYPERENEKERENVGGRWISHAVMVRKDCVWHGDEKAMRQRLTRGCHGGLQRGGVV